MQQKLIGMPLVHISNATVTFADSVAIQERS